jgi:hypothetical protein
VVLVCAQAASIHTCSKITPMLFFTVVVLE